MTEQATTTEQPTGQSANGQAPTGTNYGEAPPDTGERWLGILVIAAGCFLLLVGLDRVTGGRITGALSYASE
jgi:hypothetical protein